MRKLLPVLGLAALVLAIGVPAQASQSANGRLACVAAADPSEIWTVKPDGSDPRYLIEGTEPSWSPDGSRLAFSARTRNTACSCTSSTRMARAAGRCSPRGSSEARQPGRRTAGWSHSLAAATGTSLSSRPTARE